MRRGGGPLHLEAFHLKTQAHGSVSAWTARRLCGAAAAAAAAARTWFSEPALGGFDILLPADLFALVAGMAGFFLGWK